MIQIPAVLERCAGIDVGKRELAVALITGPADEAGVVQTRLYGTTVPELEALADWPNPGGLHQCSHGKYRFLLDSCEEHPGIQSKDRPGLCQEAFPETRRQNGF